MVERLEWQINVITAGYSVMNWGQIREIRDEDLSNMRPQLQRRVLNDVAFRSADDAAMAFGIMFYDLSNTSNNQQEFGAHIVRRTDHISGQTWYYIYDVSSSFDNRSRHNELHLSDFRVPRSSDPLDYAVRVVAFAHTHPNFYNNINSEPLNRFSDEDVTAFQTSIRNYKAFYLVTPRRDVLKMTDDNVHNYWHRPLGNIDEWGK